MTRYYFLSTCIAITFLYLIFSWDSSSSPHPFPLSSWTAGIMHTTHKGWHSRSLITPHPSPELFRPTRSNLAFIVTQNAQVEHHGFTLAFFSPSDTEDSPVAVDAMGRVLLLPFSTFDHLSQLASAISNDLPQTGHFMNAWRVKSPVTSRPINRLFFKMPGGTELRETSVQGYTDGSTNTELTTPVGEYTHLPEVLKEMFSLILEAREDYDMNGADRVVIDQVKRAAGVD